MGKVLAQQGKASEGRGPALALGLLVPFTLLHVGCLGPGLMEEWRAVERARSGERSPLESRKAEERRIPARVDDPELDRKLAAEPTLDLVQDAAERRNPDLTAAMERWVAFLEKVPQSVAPPYPALRFGYSSMFEMNTVELMQEVPFPTKLLAEGRAALAEARAMGAEFEEGRNVLREQATAAFAGLYLARRELEFVDANLVILDRLVPIAQARYEAGAVTQSDVLRAEIERATIRADRAALSSQVVTAASGLNVLLDRPPEAPIGPLAPLARPQPGATTGDLYEKALERRPELEAASQRAASADSLLSRARQEWIPDLTVGGAYVRDFGMDENEVELRAGITLPLWWGPIRAKIRAAEAESRRASAELKAARNRVLDEVKSVSARLAAAADRFRILAEEAVPRAEQNLGVAEAAYTAGKVNFLELLDSQRVLLMKKIERERALVEHAERKAEIEKAVVGEETAQ
jgi:cobalt-zinc-cadmium efflux system outer membrane protein